MKYWTIDLEGDGLRRSLNQQAFGWNFGNFDPETRIWCCTICGPKEDGSMGRRTFVCKLPPVPRRLISPVKIGDSYVWNTQAVHEELTRIPDFIREDDGFEADMYRDFLWALEHRLSTACKKGITVYFKPYGKFEYDKELLRVNFEKFNLDVDVLKCLKPYNIPEGAWKETAQQVIVGGVPNQEYMNKGIKHNMEDAKQLYEIINSIDS